MSPIMCDEKLVELVSDVYGSGFLDRKPSSNVSMTQMRKAFANLSVTEMRKILFLYRLSYYRAAGGLDPKYKPSKCKTLPITTWEKLHRSEAFAKLACETLS